MKMKKQKWMQCDSHRMTFLRCNQSASQTLECREKGEQSRALPHTLDPNILKIETNLNERIDISTYRNREKARERVCCYALQMIFKKFFWGNGNNRLRMALASIRICTNTHTQAQEQANKFQLVCKSNKYHLILQQHCNPSPNHQPTLTHRICFNHKVNIRKWSDFYINQAFIHSTHCVVYVENGSKYTFCTRFLESYQLFQLYSMCVSYGKLPFFHSVVFLFSYIQLELTLRSSSKTFFLHFSNESSTAHTLALRANDFEFSVFSSQMIALGFSENSKCAVKCTAQQL